MWAARARLLLSVRGASPQLLGLGWSSAAHPGLCCPMSAFISTQHSLRARVSHRPVVMGTLVMMDSGPAQLQQGRVFTNRLYNSPASKESFVLRYWGLGLQHGFLWDTIQPITPSSAFFFKPCVTARNAVYQYFAEESSEFCFSLSRIWWYIASHKLLHLLLGQRLLVAYPASIFISLLEQDTLFIEGQKQAWLEDYILHFFSNLCVKNEI